jgi:hypothetical protein
MREFETKFFGSTTLADGESRSAGMRPCSVAERERFSQFFAELSQFAGNSLADRGRK